MFPPNRLKLLNLSGKLTKKVLTQNRVVKTRLHSQVRDDKQGDIMKFYSDSSKEEVFSGVTDYSRFISKRSALREPALTRQITTLAYKVGKEFVSLAEGMPNEDVFPITGMSLTLRDGSKIELDRAQVSAALQYVPTQGVPELIEELRSLQVALHRPPHWRLRDVCVTSGGQFGLYSCAELLLNSGEPVALQAHTYTGMFSVLKPYQPELISIPEDKHGIVSAVLESVLEDRRKKRQQMPKFLYVVPNGSNPSGTVLPEERRRHIYELACSYDFLILEDDPYMFMNYTETQSPSFLSLDRECRVVRVDSLSKVLSPGVRPGWVTAPRPLLSRLELHMQADHLHACTLGQTIILNLLKRWGRSGLISQVSKARSLYKARRDALHLALQRHVGQLATWTLPDAGMFFWLKLNVDDVYDMVFKTAFEKGLMLVPGQACTFDSGAPSPYLRLAFSKVKVEDMDCAARLLADIIRTEQSKMALGVSQRFATQR